MPVSFVFFFSFFFGGWGWEGNIEEQAYQLEKSAS